MVCIYKLYFHYAIDNFTMNQSLERLKHAFSLMIILLYNASINKVIVIVGSVNIFNCYLLCMIIY